MRRRAALAAVFRPPASRHLTPTRLAVSLRYSRSIHFVTLLSATFSCAMSGAQGFRTALDPPAPKLQHWHTHCSLRKLYVRLPRPSTLKARRACSTAVHVGDDAFVLYNRISVRVELIGDAYAVVVAADSPEVPSVRLPSNRSCSNAKGAGSTSTPEAHARVLSSVRRSGCCSALARSGR